MRWLSGLVTVTAVILGSILAMANRQDVIVSLDPFRPDDPAFALIVPLYALIFGCVLGGVLLAWIGALAVRLTRPRP